MYHNLQRVPTELKPSYWLKEVTRLGASNQSDLFHGSMSTLSKNVYNIGSGTPPTTELLCTAHKSIFAYLLNTKSIILKTSDKQILN